MSEEPLPGTVLSGIELSRTARVSKRLNIHDLACKSLFDEVPCHITLQDRELRIVDANRKFVEEFGERIGDHCYQVFHGYTGVCPECPVQRTFEDGREHTRETVVFDQRGLPHDMFVNTKPLRDHKGNIVAVMELFTDITITKELQKRLHDSLTRFQNLFDRVPCFISVQDRDLRVMEANRYFKQHFGDKLGDYCYRLYKKRDEPCPECPVAKTFNDDRVHRSEEVLTDNDGSQIKVIVFTSPIKDSRGKTVAVMEMATDITEVRQLQEELACVGQLVAGTAHSIKNVLDGLRGGVYITNCGFRDEDKQSISTGWEMIERNVGRISNMILDMLYCAKHREPRRLPVFLPDVARDAVSLYTAKARESGVSIEVDIPEKFPTILADPKDMHSLLTNLVSNAMDACGSDETEDKQHTVSVRLREAPGEVVLEIQDNGTGMDEATRGKLFDMFFSTKGAFGTGLGLLVSHKVATEHGGAISVASAVGKGSTFTVRLPLITPEN